MTAAFFELDRALLRPPFLADSPPWLRRILARRQPPGRAPDGGPRRPWRRQAKAVVAEHRHRGHVIVLISALPGPVADWATHELTADACLQVSSDSSPAQALPENLRRFCHRYGLPHADSFGYASGGHDWRWIEGLGHPVACNPTWPLRRAAVAAGWPIVDLEAGELAPLTNDLAPEAR